MPSDWRAAVDAASGRTYWYHRKTRQSTWECPADFQDEMSTEVGGMGNSREVYSQHLTTSNISHAQYSFPSKDQIQMAAIDKDNAVAVVLQFVNTMKSVILTREFDDGKSNVISIKYLNTQIHSIMTTESDDVRNQCFCRTAPSLWCSLIDTLVKIALKSEESITRTIQRNVASNSRTCRRLALQCLWLLSLQCAAVSGAESQKLRDYFQSNHCWLALTAAALPPSSPSQRASILETWWVDEDLESVLLLCAASCNWAAANMQDLVSDSVEDPAALISEHHRIALAGFLYNKLLMMPSPLQSTNQSRQLDLSFFLLDAPDSLPRPESLVGSVALGLLNHQPMRFLSALAADKNQSLPALLLLLLTNSMLKMRPGTVDEALALNWWRAGGLSALQNIAVSTALDEDLVAMARKLLSDAMTTSSFVREQILQAFVGLGADLSRAALAIGPSPALQLRRNGSSSRSSEEDLDEEPEDDDSAAKEEEDSAAQHMSEWDVEELERALDQMHRDVEWIPTTGAPWRLCSSLLFARCPELRSVIEGFWQRGGGAGGLELRLAVPGGVMAALSRFIHTGVVDPPTSLRGCLQLLGAAKQLGMVSLEQFTAQLLGDRLGAAPQQLSVVMAWAQSTGSVPLKEVCRQHLDPPKETQRVTNGSTIEMRAVPHDNLPPQGELQFLASESLQHFMQENDWEEQAELAVEEAHCRPGGPLKPRSGGIYSLLLKASSSSSQATLSSDGHHTLQSKAAQVQKTHTPLTTTNKEIPQGDRQTSKALGRRQPTPASKSGPSKEARPQQQQQPTENRAALLLAAAGPSSSRPRGAAAPSEGADERDLGRKPSDREAVQPPATTKLNLSKNPQSEMKAVGRQQTKSTLVVDPLTAPKRSSSPVSSQEFSGPGDNDDKLGRGVGHSAASSATLINTISNGRDDPGGPPVPISEVQQVRGSLTLLKTRPRIRRRTATDVESEMAGAAGNIPHAVNDMSKAFEGAATSRSNEHLDTLPPPLNGGSLLGHQSIGGNGSAPQKARARPAVPVAASYEAESEEEGLSGSANVPMRTCGSCGRHFNPLSFEKHAKVCAKVFVQKRKVFDSAGMRIRAIPELQEMVLLSGKGRKGGAGRGGSARKSAASSAASSEQNSSKVWRQQSEAFRDVIRAAREYQAYEQQVQQAAVKGFAPPPQPPKPAASSVDPNLVPCPHCERRFSAKAADRHIPQCQTIRAKPSSLKKGAGLGGGLGASNNGLAASQRPMKTGWI